MRMVSREGPTVSPAARNASQPTASGGTSPSSTTVAVRSESRKPLSRSQARYSVPRKPLTHKRIRARLRTRMSAASPPRKRVLSGTTTPPAAMAPKAPISQSGPLGAQMATRSPGLSPAAMNARPAPSMDSARAG